MSEQDEGALERYWESVAARYLPADARERVRWRIQSMKEMEEGDTAIATAKLRAATPELRRAALATAARSLRHEAAGLLAEAREEPERAAAEAARGEEADRTIRVGERLAELGHQLRELFRV